MGKSRNRKTETMVYAGLWALAIGIYMLDIMRNRAQMSQPLIDHTVVRAILSTMLPFFGLFLINNVILIPRLLLRNRLLPYFILTAALVIVLWTYQYFYFIHKISILPADARPIPPPHMRSLLPMPLVLDFTYALLVVGCNLAIALMFQRFDDKLDRESLMKANAETQLTYLKAQINPHFYMNMLNNIHGMIEINPEQAQSMVIDMSQLMRYTLYDSSRPIIPLSDEIVFLQNYLRLMRQRFPEDSLSIRSQFPPEAEMRGISIPTLLFLVFIENAFKHGVSYRESSFVSVSIEIVGTTVRFSCMNSAHSCGNESDKGIGLKNIRERLKLLYGSGANLSIVHTESVYTVHLTIPAHETQNSHN